MMNTLIAYWGVVFIWATTPLGIAVSSEGLSFWLAAAGRSTLALIVSFAILRWRKESLFPNRQAVTICAVAAVGFAPQMTLVYWASQHVPSGVISVVFALNPCFIYVLSAFFLKEGSIVYRQVLSLLLAIVGMALIYSDQLVLGEEAAIGMAVLVFATLVFAVMSVTLKYLLMDVTISPLSQNTGTLMFSCPLLLIFWVLFDGRIPEQPATESIFAVVYLAIFGSVVGSTLYFYIFKKMAVVTVSLITLITPLFAITLGFLLHDEPLTPHLLWGAAIVIVALLIFENLPARLLKRMVEKRTR